MPQSGGYAGLSGEVTRHNMALHAEPYLGRASMSCFLYGPGERGCYPC